MGEAHATRRGKPNLRLKQEREKRFWTLEDVATRISNLPDFASGEPDPRTVGRWERGSSFPTPRYCRALCTVFQLEAHLLGLANSSRENNLPPDATPLETTISSRYDGVEKVPSTPLPQEKGRDTGEMEGLLSQESKSRLRLLKRVHSFWIDNFLTRSLQTIPSILLLQKNRPDAVLHGWYTLLQGTHYTPPSVIKPVEIPDEFEDTLLLLGDVGSGKTTQLLLLAQKLLERAEQNRTQPYPVILLLSTWQARTKSLTHWLLTELERRYEVPRLTGQHWIDNDRLILLFDDLNALSTRARARCILAINHYRQAHPFTAMVVCCTTDIYFNQDARLQFQQAAQIQPLRSEQLTAYLTSHHEILEETRSLFHQLPDLQHFLTTPLRLSLLIQACRNVQTPANFPDQLVKAQLQYYFQAYIRTMLERQNLPHHHLSHLVINELSYIALSSNITPCQLNYVKRIFSLLLQYSQNHQQLFLLNLAVACQLLQKKHHWYEFTLPQLQDYFSMIAQKRDQN